MQQMDDSFHVGGGLAASVLAEVYLREGIPAGDPEGT